MSNNLTLSSASFDTSTQQFGSAALSAGYGIAAAPLVPGYTFSVGAWFKRVAGAGGLEIICAQINAFWFGLQSTGEVAARYGAYGTEVAINSSGSYNNGAWHYIELCIDATAGGKLFVDGSLVASSATTPVAAGVVLSGGSSNNFAISTLRPASAAYEWQGKTDEVSLWSTALHSTTFTPPAAELTGGEAGLVSVWHLNSNGNDSVSAATAVTMTGPTGGTVGVASTNFTIGANGTISGTVTVTPSDGGGGGTFTPTTVNISSGSPTATFTYTPASAGAKAISVTNSGGLANPSSITYTATAAALYTRVDATDPIGGQAIMILVPAAGSSNPYNSANPTNVIIHCHGDGETEDGLLTDTRKAACRNALLDAGYILAGSNAHGSNWGGQVAVDDYAALDRYLRANYNVRAMALWSQSMGGLTGLQALTQQKLTPCGWLGTYPVCNLANLYGLGTFTASINTAFGITGSGTATYANRTYGADPALKAASAYRDIPMRFYASSGDTVVPKAQNSDVLAAIVANSRHEAAVVACSGDHGDASHFQASDYVSFFQRAFAAAIPVTRSVTVTLTSDGTTPRASLSGLKWAFYDEATPNVALEPASKGAAGSTNGSGVLTINVSTALAPGSTGWLVVTDSDGTTTQIPAAKAFAGPVTVA